MNTELPGYYCNEGIPAPRVLCHSLAGATEFPGKGMYEDLTELFRSSGYGYGCLTELPEVPGIVAQAYRTHRSSKRVQNVLYPYLGYCGHGRTELPEVPGTGRYECRTELPGVPGTGTGMNALQNLQKFFAG